MCPSGWTLYVSEIFTYHDLMSLFLPGMYGYGNDYWVVRVAQWSLLDYPLGLISCFPSPIYFFPFVSIYSHLICAMFAKGAILVSSQMHIIYHNDRACFSQAWVA
jgi:hypothetical protein